MTYLQHITARHNKTDKVVDLFFTSIKKAKEHNPDYVNFRFVQSAARRRKLSQKLTAKQKARPPTNLLAITRARVIKKFKGA